MIEDLEVVDMPQKKESKIVVIRTPEQILQSIDETDRDSIKEALAETLEDDSIWQSYKKKKLPKIGSNSVDLAFVFIYAVNVLQLKIDSFDSELQEKLKELIKSLDYTQLIKRILEQYGNGRGFGSHLKVYEIQKIVEIKRNEIEKFISLVIGKEE